MGLFDFLEDAFDAVTDLAGEALEVAMDVWETIGDAVGDVVDGVRDIAEDVLDGTFDWGDAIVYGLCSTVGTGVAGVIGYITGLFSNAKKIKVGQYTEEQKIALNKRINENLKTNNVNYIDAGILKRVYVEDENGDYLGNVPLETEVKEGVYYV